MAFSCSILFICTEPVRGLKEIVSVITFRDFRAEHFSLFSRTERGRRNIPPPCNDDQYEFILSQTCSQ